MAAEARHKRAMGEYKELNDIIDELEENSLLQKASGAVAPAQAQEFDLDNMPPLAYYLLLQKLRQCKYMRTVLGTRCVCLTRSYDNLRRVREALKQCVEIFYFSLLFCLQQ